MKLLGTIEFHIPGERILREPTFWDRVKKKFGGEPDLRTNKLRSALEAAALIHAYQHAMRRIGATNAISLVVDDQVLFQDRDGKDDDLGELVLAFSDNAAVFGGQFRLLRLAVEHEEAGLHAVLELIARGVHFDDEATGRVIVSGRVKAFEPRPGEDAEAYRARVEPLTRDPSSYEVYRRQFDAYVGRVTDALRGALPEARVEVVRAEAQVRRPGAERARRPETAAPPTSPDYDPHDFYYPNPMGMVLSAMMWSSILSMAMPPHVVLVNEHGREIGPADEVAHEAAALETDSGASGGADDWGGGDGAEVDLGGGDLGGGNFDGGDFGGGDFGGGDFGGDFF